MIEKFGMRHVTLYPSGICNLKCSYCYIAKNEKMKMVHDRLIEACRDPSYYISLMKKLEDYFTMDKLEYVGIWGAEPSYGFIDVAPVINQLIDVYPTIDDIAFSTNFCSTNFLDRLEYLIMNTKAHNFGIQISIDGPPFINDKNRGEGVTEKILENYKLLFKRFNKLNEADKHIRLSFKPTLSIDELRTLYEKDLVLDYYKFFEDSFIIPFDEANNKNMRLYYPHISLVSPSRYTTEDGLFYADFLKYCDSLNASKKLKFITPGENYRIKDSHSKMMQNENSYTLCGGFCGAGVSEIGLLPDNNLCLCHRIFNQFAEEYAQTATKYTSSVTDNRIYEAMGRKSLGVFPLEECERVLPMLRSFYNYDSTAILTTSATLIRTLAMAGQVPEKFKDEKIALKGAKLLMVGRPFCLRDNCDISGTITPQTLGEMRLYLNGALEYQARGTEYEF